MTPLHATPAEAKRLEKNLDRPKKSVQVLTSELMVEYMHKIEARLKRRLTPDEVRSPVYLTGARVYAEALVKTKKGAK
jgi:hypothetical protein